MKTYVKYPIFLLAVILFLGCASADNVTDNMTEFSNNQTINQTNETCVNLLTELNLPIISDIGYFWCAATDWINVQLPHYGIDLASALLIVIFIAILLFVFGRGSMILQTWVFKFAVIMVVCLVILFMLGMFQ